MSNIEIRNSMQNFFMVSRLNTNSFYEKKTDFFLTPLRTLFGGKNVIVLDDKLYQVNSPSSNKYKETAKKIIAVILLPFALLAAFVKVLSIPFLSADYTHFVNKKFTFVTDCPSTLYQLYKYIYSTSDFVSKKEGHLIFEPLKLAECTCSVSQAFDRLQNSRRDNLENAIVNRLSHIQTDKSHSIHLLSMGSGGLMSDFMTLGKLIFSGFKNIAIDCVDPRLNENGLQEIKNFFKDYPEVSVSIQGYKNIDDVPIENNNYQAILGIDYDDLTGWGADQRIDSLTDLMKARRRLCENGFLALGFSDEDSLSGSNMEPIILNSKPSLIHNLATDLIEQLKEKEELSVSIPSINFAGSIHLLFASLSLAIEKTKISYKKISIHHQKNPDNSEKFKTLLQVLFPNSNIELSEHKNDNKYDLFFTGALEQDYISKSYLDLLNSDAVTYILQPPSFFYRFSLCRQNGIQKQVQVLAF